MEEPTETIEEPIFDYFDNSSIQSSPPSITTPMTSAITSTFLFTTSSMDVSLALPIIENFLPHNDVTSPTIVEILGRGHREKISPVKLCDFVINTVFSKSPSSSSSAPLSSSGTPFPLAHYVNCDKFTVKHKIFLAAFTNGVEPQSFKIVVKDAGWREAMQKEIKTLKDNDTWDMTILPQEKKALGSK